MPNWALIIGIERYKRPLDTLDSALNDARQIRDVLINDFDFAESRTLLLADPSKAKIKETISKTIPSWDIKKNDQLLVFFAGHGLVRKTKKKKQWFLVPADGKVLRRNKRRHIYWDWDSFVALGEFLEINDTFLGKHILYVFDSCHSGYAIAARGRGDDKSCSILAAATARQSVVDTLPGEQHSILTATILDALTGWAALDPEIHPNFSSKDLRDFAQREGTRRSRERLPIANVATPFGTDVPTVEGELFLFEPQSERLPWEILRLLTSHNTQERRSGLARLGRLSTDDDEDNLAELRIRVFERILAEDPNPTVRTSALDQIGLVADPAIYDQVAEELKSENLPTLKAAIQALVRLALANPEKQTNARQRLKDLFKMPQVEHIRILIDESLARLNDEGGIRRTLLRMEQADSRLRGRSLSVLQPTENLINKLVSQLQGGGDWRARRTAAESLGYFGIGRALEPLLKHIGEFEHWLVRVAAVEALGQIANQIDASGTQELLETLNHDRSLNVRTATAECLGCIPDQIGDTEDALVRSLIYDEAWRVRRAAAEALALSESVGAVQEMAMALRDSHFRVRREAALALGQLLPKLRGPSRSKQLGMDSLRETAEKDASEFVRRAAKDAVVRAGG